MTQRRPRRLEDLPRTGLSARPQELSVRAVHQRAAHDHTPPDRLTAGERRADCRALQTVQPDSRRARTIALCGLTVCDTHPFQHAWTTRTFVRPPREQPLPVILSPTAVRTILACARLPRDRVGLATAQRFRSTPIRLPNGGVKHYSVLRSNAPPPKTTHPSKPPAFYHPYIFPSIQV